MTESSLENPNPSFVDVDSLDPGLFRTKFRDLFEFVHAVNAEQSLDEQEVFDTIKGIKDPEHGDITLEQLRIVSPGDISVKTLNAVDRVRICFTPTIPTCSVATLIGLSIFAKAKLCLHSKSSTLVQIKLGTHVQDVQINKQLSDKERLSAALENSQILDMLKSAASGSDLVSPDFVL